MEIWIIFSFFAIINTLCTLLLIFCGCMLSLSWVYFKEENCSLISRVSSHPGVLETITLILAKKARLWKPFSSVQFSSVAQSCLTLCDPMNPMDSLSITNSRSLLKLMSIESVMPSNHLICCHPRLLLPSIFLSIRVNSSESVLCIRWPKYWSFSFSISPSNEYSGLISFRMDWLDLLAVQGALKSLLQHHSSKASILQCSAFFIIQLSHPYMTTGKTIPLTRWTFVGKVMEALKTF